MSHAYVRAQMRAVAQAVLVPVGFEWVESINFASLAKALPGKWFSMEFVVGDESRAALGVPTLMREQGTAVVQIFCEQQIGDAPVIAGSDILRDALTNWADATGQLRVVDCAPAIEMNSGDFRGAFFGVFVSVRYQFDRLVNESPILERARA
jgi:hypothetical protein